MMVASSTLRALTRLNRSAGNGLPAAAATATIGPIMMASTTTAAASRAT